MAPQTVPSIYILNFIDIKSSAIISEQLSIFHYAKNTSTAFNNTLKTVIILHVDENVSYA